MQFERQQEVTFRSDITRAVLALMTEGKKLSPNNIAKESGYTRKDIELNLYDISLIIEKLED